MVDMDDLVKRLKCEVPSVELNEQAAAEIVHLRAAALTRRKEYDDALVAAERERCAKLCLEKFPRGAVGHATALTIATAIRAEVKP